PVPPSLSQFIPVHPISPASRYSCPVSQFLPVPPAPSCPTRAPLVLPVPVILPSSSQFIPVHPSSAQFLPVPPSSAQFSSSCRLPAIPAPSPSFLPV
ncbi:hypothetical protein N324_10294, partial [Chlamydotis macqueenii]